MHDDLLTIYGKPVSNDSAYVQRLRFHQSWYRRHRLDRAYDTAKGYGNYLCVADGDRGTNFLTEAIAAFAFTRLAEHRGAVTRSRLLCNMLSSQPMCFNLFAPLALNPDLARILVGSLVPGRPIDTVTVAIEAALPENLLQDRTAFDALITYESAGQQGFIGVETKYSERFSPRSHRHAAATYAQWFDGHGWWRTEARESLYAKEIQQLWRNHMLALALGTRQTHGSGELLVLYAPGDPHMDAALTRYQGCLSEHTSPPRAIALDTLIAGWRTLAPDAATRAWLDAFAARYLALSPSEAEWQRYHASTRN